LCYITLQPIPLNEGENYIPGGEVLKLLRIKLQRNKRIKTVSRFIVNKLPHKDAVVYNAAIINSGGMVGMY
jgi:hypothetical protein